MSQDNLVPLRIEKCIAERREPGTMVFNVRPGGGDDTGGNGWIIGVDQSGHFPLKLKFDTPAQDTCALPNGNLLFSLTAAGIIREVTRSGETVRQWHMRGEMAGQDPSGGEYRDRHSALASPGQYFSQWQFIVDERRGSRVPRLA
jgi:hypothetical protein